MRTPLILNNASSRYSAANIQFFEDGAQLCLHLEPWAVSSGEFFAFDADGQILDLATDGISVQLVETGTGKRGDLLAMLSEFVSDPDVNFGVEGVKDIIKWLKLIDTQI
jgi:hypothetical protein